jgi:Carboxypeptidase activation peptide
VVSENSTYLDLLVSPSLLTLITQLLNCSNIEYQTLVPDLQKSIDEVSVD